MQRLERRERPQGARALIRENYSSRKYRPPMEPGVAARQPGVVRAQRRPRIIRGKAKVADVIAAITNVRIPHDRYAMR